MKPSKLFQGLLTVGLGLVFQAGSARAGQLSVNPVTIHLDSSIASEMLVLRNTGTIEARYQISAFSWSEPPRGEPLLKPTTDVAVFPPVLSIAPGESRNVRVGALVAAAGPLERTYRLILEELPPAVKGNGVTFLNKISIPIFFAPQAARQATSVAFAGKSSFTLRNDGTVHLKAREVRAKALDAGGSVLAQKSWPGWYVLAGGERIYTMPVPPKSCASVRTLDVTVHSAKGDLHQLVATPQGVCGS